MNGWLNKLAHIETNKRIVEIVKLWGRDFTLDIYKKNSVQDLLLNVYFSEIFVSLSLKHLAENLFPNFISFIE